LDDAGVVGVVGEDALAGLEHAEVEGHADGGDAPVAVLAEVFGDGLEIGAAGQAVFEEEVGVVEAGEGPGFAVGEEVASVAGEHGQGVAGLEDGEEVEGRVGGPVDGLGAAGFGGGAEGERSGGEGGGVDLEGEASVGGGGGGAPFLDASAVGAVGLDHDGGVGRGASGDGEGATGVGVVMLRRIQGDGDHLADGEVGDGEGGDGGRRGEDDADVLHGTGGEVGGQGD